MGGVADSISAPSRWPRRLLIVAVISLMIGLVGLLKTLPEIDEALRPDHLNKEVIEPRESIEVNLTGLRTYSFFQNLTDSDEIDGSITIILDNKEVDLKEPSLISGVGVMEFDNGVVFKPMGWIQPNENSRVEITSESNLTIYLVDQNEVSEVAFTEPTILASCLSLLLGGCLLPVAFVLFLIRKKGSGPKSNVTLRTADGREVKLSVDTSTSGGAVLTTDQIYTITQLQERAGPDGKITLDFKMVPNQSKQQTPPPFADRPDLDNLIEKQEVSIKEISTSSKFEAEENNVDKSNWKDWDEG